MTNKNSTDRVGHLGLYIWFTSVKISGVKLWRHDWYWKGKILTEVENIKILAGVASPSLKPLASPSLSWDTHPQKSEANWTNRTHEEYSRLHRFWFQKNKATTVISRKYPTKTVRPQHFESLWEWKFQPTTHSQRKVIKLEDSHTDSSNSPLGSLTWNKSDCRSKNVISVCSRSLRKCSNTICICDVESDFKTSVLNTAPQSPCVFEPAQVGDHPKLRSNSICHLCRFIGFASGRVFRVVCPNQVHGSTFNIVRRLQIIKDAKCTSNLIPCQNALLIFK